MAKGSAKLCSVLVLLAIAAKFAASSDTDISYQIGQFNNKLTYLQGRLDLFDYITEGNVSVLLHRLEVKDLKCAENVTVHMNDTNAKLIALEGKLNALTVSSNVSSLLLQMNESNGKMNNLVDRMDSLATDVSKLNTLESKFNALATTVSSNVTMYAENVNVPIEETSRKLMNLGDKMDSHDAKLNTLESKFNALASTVTNFVDAIKEILLKPFPSCVEAFERPLLNRGSGVYNIQLNGTSSPFDAYCMADPKGDLPWTVVQRRVDGSVDFYRNWTEYQRGFGDLENNFFIGLEKLHSLTTKGDPQELWVMLTNVDGISAHAYYDRFAIGNEAEKYPLKVLGQYSGDAGNSLQYHKYMNFSTFDNDNDLTNTTNCAERFESGWWFDSCYQCNLNGIYGLLRWVHLRDITVPVKYAHMAIRPTRK